jgi:hypothetical protein
VRSLQEILNPPERVDFPHAAVDKLLVAFNEANAAMLPYLESLGLAGVRVFELTADEALLNKAGAIELADFPTPGELALVLCSVKNKIV